MPSYAAAGRGCSGGRRHCEDWRSQWRGSEVFFAAISSLKQEVGNFGSHFSVDDNGSMVLAEARGRPRGRGGGEGADSVKSDGEMVEKGLDFGILTFLREATSLG